MRDLLAIDGVRTHFETDRGVVKAVDDVTITVEPGQTVGVVGESGSGKSVTALSTMDLVERPGRVVDGQVRFGALDTVRRLARQYPRGVATDDPGESAEGFVHLVDASVDRAVLPDDLSVDRSLDDTALARQVVRARPSRALPADEADGLVDVLDGYVDLTAAPETAMRDVRGGDMGMIFQDPMTSLNPAITVGEQIAESLRLHRYGQKRKDSWFNAVREAAPIGRRDDEVVTIEHDDAAPFLPDEME